MTHEEMAREFYGCECKKVTSIYGHSRECQAMKGEEWIGAPEPPGGCTDLSALLSSVAAEATAAERERCAGVVDGWGYRGTGKIAYEAIAAAIRKEPA